LKAWLNTSKDGKVGDAKKLRIRNYVKLTFNPQNLLQLMPTPNPLQEEECSAVILRALPPTSAATFTTASATPEEHTHTPTLLALPDKPPTLMALPDMLFPSLRRAK
jgi:hypothetical protein